MALQPDKLPTPDWSKPMGVDGLTDAMCAALLARSWVEAASLASKVGRLILEKES